MGRWRNRQIHPHTHVAVSEKRFSAAFREHKSALGRHCIQFFDRGPAENYVAVAELAYAQDLESCPARVVGSTPTRDRGVGTSWV